MRKKSTSQTGILFLFLFLCAPMTICAEPADAESILSEARLFGESRYMTMEVEMIIENSSGEKRRSIDISINNEGSEYKLYMQIIDPSFLRKMKFLQLSSGDGTSLQWIATSRGARKITSSGNDERVFDSDFTASDFSSIRTSDFLITDSSDIIIGESPGYRIEVSSIDDRNRTNKKVLFIDSESHQIREVEYFNGTTLVKRYKVISTQNVNGKVFPDESLMEDFEGNSRTRLVFKKIGMPGSIPDKVFHYRNL